MKAQTVPTLVMVATMLFAIGMPVSAQASDWKEYALACGETWISKVTVSLVRDGKEVDEVMQGGIVVVVNKMMDDGWQPLGSLSFYTSRWFCQAMVKE